MRRIILATIILLALITILATFYNHKIEPGDKSELVRLVLEERMKSDPVEGSLLVVETTQLRGVNLPQRVDGVPVVLVTMNQLDAWGKNSVSIHAILFTEVSASQLTSHVSFSIFYNSYFAGWNEYGNYDFVNLWGTWIIDSKNIAVLV